MFETMSNPKISASGYSAAGNSNRLLPGRADAEERAGGLGLREDSTLRILARAPAIGGAR